MNQPRLMNRPTRASHGSLLRYRSTASRRNVQCPEVIHYSGYISMGKHDYETRQKKRRPDRALQCPSLFGSLRAPLALRHRRVRGRSPRGDFPAHDRGRNRVFWLEEMECDQFYPFQTRTKKRGGGMRVDVPRSAVTVANFEGAVRALCMRMRWPSV